MTCETARDQLQTLAVREFDGLAHLRRCPDCRELARVIAAEEAEMYATLFQGGVEPPATKLPTPKPTRVAGRAEAAMTGAVLLAAAAGALLLAWSGTPEATLHPADAAGVDPSADTAAEVVDPEDGSGLETERGPPADEPEVSDEPELAAEPEEPEEPEEASGFYPDVVEVTLYSNLGVKRCFVPLFKSGHTPDRIDITFTLLPSGQAIDLGVAQPDLHGGEFETCMREAVTAIEFPAFRGEPELVEFPFVMSR